MRKKIRSSPDTRDPLGRYANYLIVGSNAFEFLLDFGEAYGSDTEHIHTRIVTAPTYAKAMWTTLGSALNDFELAHGLIPAPEAKGT